MIITVCDFKKTNKKYEITFSNDYTLKCNENLVLKYKLFKDHELTLEEYDSCLNDALFYDYYDKVLSMLDKKDVSSHKIKCYLADNGLDKEQIDTIINDLSNKGLIDDERYFKLLADHYLRKGYGPLYIKQKGFLESIDSSIVSDVINNISLDLFIEQARKLYIKKNLIIKETDEYKRSIKNKNYLFSRGYTVDIINIAIKDSD